MKKAFLSFASDDLKIAQQLHANLQDAEVSGWMPQIDIGSDHDIAQTIRQSLKTVSALIVLVSPKSKDSQAVQFEVGAAWALGKQIIPIIIGDANTEIGLPDWISQYKFLDARNRSMKEIANEVARAISDE